MKYTIKWIEENLGITRKTIRNYEEKGLLSSKASRNPTNNYREYDDDDIDRIWGIKTLQGIGYSLSEIHDLIENPETDLYKSISAKVVDLEKKRDEITSYIEFASTIKLTGTVPSVKKLGSMKFSDFMEYSRKNWSIRENPCIEDFMDATNSLQELKSHELTKHDIDRLESIANQINHVIDLFGNPEKIQPLYMMNAYYEILARMQSLDPHSQPVQIVVEQLFHFTEETIIKSEKKERFTPNFFARYTVPLFLKGSDLGSLNNEKYGPKGAEFIAKAIAFFGGYKSPEDL